MIEIIERNAPLKRSEKILRNHVNPDGLPNFPTFFKILLELREKIKVNQKREEELKEAKRRRKKNTEISQYEPVVLICIITGGPGQGKTTTLEAVVHTIQRVLGLDPEVIKFDTVRANFLKKKGKLKLADLDQSEKAEFKEEIVQKLAVKPKPVKDRKEPQIVCIEGVFFGDTEPGDKDEVERGQSALREMIQDPLLSPFLLFFNVFGTQEVIDQAIKQRILTDLARDDWEYIQLVRAFLGEDSFREPTEEDRGKTIVLEEHRAMASVEMITQINDIYFRLARRSFGSNLGLLLTEEILFEEDDKNQKDEDIVARMSLQALAEQIKENLTEYRIDEKRMKKISLEIYGYELLDNVHFFDPSYIPSLQVGKVELEMLMIRILYFYKILQSMGFDRIVPTMKNGIEEKPARVLNCINQLWRERDNN